MRSIYGVYIAAPFHYGREHAKTVRLELKHRGFFCTSHWIDSHITDSSDESMLQGEAEQDLYDIGAADALILLNDHPPSVGRSIETGYALALRMPIFLIGPKTSVFHHHPLVRQIQDTREVPYGIQD